MTTLDEAQDDWVETIRGNGGACPCCNRFGKIYGRKLNNTMLRSFLWLADYRAGGWVDVPKTAPKYVLRTNQLSTLRWWGLIERRENDDPKQKHSGMWRCTELGFRFANNKASIPDEVFTYDGGVVRKSDRMVYISTIETRNFDYSDVMRTSYGS